MAKKKAGRIYVPLDVDYPDNPKIIEAGEKAEVLYIRGLCLAKRTLSDGYLDRRQLDRMGLSAVFQRAATLVRCGLWSYMKIGDKVVGYQIVGFLDRNDSAEEVAQLSAIRSRSGSKGGKAGSKLPPADEANEIAS